MLRYMWRKGLSYVAHVRAVLAKVRRSHARAHRARNATQLLSLAAAAASRSDQPIAFGSEVIDSRLSSRRLPELPQVARKLHELSQESLQLLSQLVLQEVSHQESQ